MPPNDLIFRQLLEGGYDAIQLGDPVSKVYDVYGRPLHEEGEDHYGFMYYGLLRFGSTEHRIDETGFDFTRGYDDLMRIAAGDQEFVFQSGTTVHACFGLLNALGIPWIASGNDIFEIQAFLPTSGVLIKADSYSGELTYIKQNRSLTTFDTHAFLQAFEIRR